MHKIQHDLTHPLTIYMDDKPALVVEPNGRLHGSAIFWIRFEMAFVTAVCSAVIQYALSTL